ncbi:MAG: translocation/assembly module TamB domain-containing protein, partial [Bacteroidota bacterium]
QTPGKLNFQNLHLTELEASLSMFLYPQGETDIQLAYLSFLERPSGFRLDHLSMNLLSEVGTATSANFPTTYSVTSLQDFSLQTGRTRMAGELLIPGRNLTNLFSTEAEISYRAKLLDNSRLDFATLDYLVEDTLPLRGEVYLSGPINGTNQRVESPQVQIAYAQDTRIAGALRLENMLEPRKSELVFRTSKTAINFQELQQLLPGMAFPPVLKDLGLLEIVGSFEGNYWDFQTNMGLASKLGQLDANLHIQLPPVFPELTFEGNLTTRALNVDALAVTDLRFSQNLSLTSTIKGSGADLESLELDADVLMKQSELLGYFLDSLRTDVHIHQGNLRGLFEGADQEGYAEASFFVGLEESPRTYEFSGNIDHLNLATYQLMPTPTWFDGKIQFQMAGDSLDQLAGEMLASNVRFTQPTDSGQSELELESLYFQAVSNGQDKYYNLKSPLLHVDFQGNFFIQELIAESQRFLYENQLYFLNQDSMMREYYAQKDSIHPEMQVRMGLSILPQLNELFAFWDLPVAIAPNSDLLFNLSTGETDQIGFELRTDSIQYGDMHLTQTAMDLYLAKLATEPFPFMAGGVQLEQAKIGPQFQVEEVALNLQGAQNVFETDLEALQGNSNSEVRLKMHTWFAPDGKVYAYMDSAVSQVRVQEEVLTFGSQDSMILEKGELYVNNLILQDSLRYVRFHGDVSKSPDRYLAISTGQISLGLLEELFPLSYTPSGMFNIDLLGYQLLKKPRFEWFASVDDFTLNEFRYGRLYSEGRWKQPDDTVRFELKLVDDLDTVRLALDGRYALEDSLAPLFANLSTSEGFPLDYIEPFVEDAIYDLGGKVELEEFVVQGHPENLVVTGTGHFQDAGFGVEYFQTEYDFNGSIRFDNDRITLPRLRLYDKNRNHADFHGVILHQGLRDFEFDLQLDSVRNFLVMNTRKPDNELFYGNLFIENGLASITGDLEQISVQAIASTGKGSSLKIPVSDYDDFGRPEYIYFKGEEEDADGPINTGLLGFDLDLTVLANRNAEVELIFDERVGDIIRGRGEGSISLNINDKGDFSMFGDYQIIAGDYLFTSQNVINKRFSVKEGGTIIWTGDPFEADLDLQAIYPVKANIQDLLQEDNPIRTDVNVLMHMEGNLAAPQISLSLELPNIKGVDADKVVNYLRSIQFDEQELNKQVFSLMVFNRFAPIGGDLGDNLASTGVTTSISEMLSNQLNYLLSQVTGEFVDVNVNTSNFQDVNLLVSARLFNDRVTLERDGTLVQTTDQESSLLSLGNIRVIIRLLPSEADLSSATRRNRELVLEVFTREGFSSNAQGSTTTNSETGLGVFFRKDFDRLSDLLKRKKAK